MDRGVPATVSKKDVSFLRALIQGGKDHVRGTPYHPMTQGKIERWHQTLKIRIVLEHYYLPGDLEAQIDDFSGHYNHRRYDESLGNLTRPPMSTSGAARPSCCKKKGPNARHSSDGACNINGKPLRSTQKVIQSLPSLDPHPVSKTLKSDTL